MTLADRIEQWRVLRAAATPGEWVVESDGNIHAYGDHDRVLDSDEIERNNHLTVAQHALVPDLIAEVERLGERAEQWKTLLLVERTLHDQEKKRRTKATAQLTEAQALAARLEVALKRVNELAARQLAEPGATDA